MPQLKSPPVTSRRKALVAANGLDSHATNSTAGRRTANSGMRGDVAATPESIRQAIGKRIGAHKLGMWFGHTTISIEGAHLLINPDSQFVANWIESHFDDVLKEVAAEMLGGDARVVIAVVPTQSKAGVALTGAAPVPPLPPAPAKLRMGARTVRTDLRKLDDFVVGASNKMAHAAACRIAEDTESRRNSPLFIHGSCGLGKTHLLQGICQRYIERTGRHLHVRYVTGEQFTNEYITAVRNNSLDSFRQKNRRLDLLAIDDVHFLSNKVRTQTEFLYTLDAIDLGGARIVLASDNHPHHIKRFNQALVNRFMSGMVVKVETPDRAMRIELIKRLSKLRGLPVNDAAIDLIADQCLGSVREIEGSITKLAAYQSLLNTPEGAESGEIGLAMTQQLFREHIWQPTQTVRMQTLIEVICARLNVVKSDVMGNSRHRRVVLARGLVAYLGRELTTHSFPEIAHHLGRNNHSTIHTADQRLRKQIEANDRLDLGSGDQPIGLKDLIDQLRRNILERQRQAA